MNSNIGEYTKEIFQQPFYAREIEDYPEQILDYLKDTSNPIWKATFSERLTNYIKLRGFSENENDSEAKTLFLFHMYQSIPEINITKSTLRKWFSGKNRPFFDIRARERMYELCFVLHLSYHEVSHFFHHVYLDRCFNCRNIKEAIYCYCFSNGLPYSRFLQLSHQIKEICPEIFLQNTNPVCTKPENTVYTLALTEKIRSFTNDNDFIKYILLNKNSFLAYNVKGRIEMERLCKKIRGSKRDQEQINRLRKSISNKKKITVSFSDFDGLAMKELFFNYSFYSPEQILEEIKGINITSNDFILFRIFDINLRKRSSSFSDELKNITRIAAINFPSKQLLSNILNTRCQKGQQSMPSFDAIRKMLILLHFYEFCVEYRLESMVTVKTKSTVFYNDYLNDVNDLLTSCGYPPFYYGNPYDLIFLFSARTDMPLDTFREVISQISEKDE